MRARADRAGNLADGDDFADMFQTSKRAGKFIVHQRHFQTERRRLGMDAVAAADARREFVLLRAAGDDGQKFFNVGNQDVRALHHLHGEAGVARCRCSSGRNETSGSRWSLIFSATAVVKPMTSWFKRLSPVPLARSTKAGQFSEPFFRSRLDLGEIALRHDPLAGPAPRWRAVRFAARCCSLFSSVQIARISGRE